MTDLNGFVTAHRLKDTAKYVQELLEKHCVAGSLEKQPSKFAEELVQEAFSIDPDFFSGKKIGRPSMPIAAFYVLRRGVQALGRIEPIRQALLVCLGNLLAAIAEDRFLAWAKPGDIEFLNDAVSLVDSEIAAYKPESGSGKLVSTAPGAEGDKNSTVITVFDSRKSHPLKKLSVFYSEKRPVFSEKDCFIKLHEESLEGQDKKEAANCELASLEGDGWFVPLDYCFSYNGFKDCLNDAKYLSEKYSGDIRIYRSKISDDFFLLCRKSFIEKMQKEIEDEISSDNECGTDYCNENLDINCSEDSPLVDSDDSDIGFY